MALRIADILRERKIAQARLADGADVTPGYLSEVINGKKVPSLAVLTRMADWLEVPVSALFDSGAAEPDRSQGFGEPAATPFAAPRSVTDLIQRAMPGTRTFATYQMGRAVLGFGLLPRDILVVDLGRRPTDGDVVLANRVDQELGTAETMIARLSHGLLLADQPLENPLPSDADDVAVLGVIAGSLRGVEA